MGQTTSIEWTDATWNPLRGCSRKSKGCMNCYAERTASRFSGRGMPYENLTKDGKWTGEVRLIPERLYDPKKWNARPRKIFVNSMSDLFHESLDDVTTAIEYGKTKDKLARSGVESATLRTQDRNSNGPTKL